MIMKKKIAAIAVGLVLSSTQAFALIGFNVQAGGGLWMSGMNTATISDEASSTTANISLTNDNSLYGYIRFTHPIPLVPNLRVETLQFSTSGSASLTMDILGYSVSSTNQTLAITLNQTDYTVFWGAGPLSLLTLGIIDLEWGIDVKMIDGSLSYPGITTGAFTAPIPMAHLGAVVNIGAIPVVGSFVDAKVMGYYRTIGLMTDMDIKVSYNLPIPVPIVSFGVEVGYRQQTLGTADASSLLSTLGITSIPSVDFDYSGVYFGANLSF